MTGLPRRAATGMPRCRMSCFPEVLSAGSYVQKKFDVVGEQTTAEGLLVLNLTDQLAGAANSHFPPTLPDIAPTKAGTAAIFEVSALPAFATLSENRKKN
ncbi:hypothetical protein [Paracoccus zhejiangensis]|uniref:hypothetical protein n=1 Tax=Paracoccus zhejiangensis TaxID=1077935 RepID=UPI001E4F5706|nr:hypothetical protein [Paracoccus zhejiangensis]